MRLTIDSNILVYAADVDAGKRHDIAKALIVAASRADCLLTVQSVAEFFFVSVRKRKLPPEDAERAVRIWSEVFPVKAASPESLSAAMRSVREHRIAFWDAMLVAVAEDAGCDLLVSEDLQHGRRIGRVEIVNPFGPEMPPVLREALRLT